MLYTVGPSRAYDAGLLAGGGYLRKLGRREARQRGLDGYPGGAVWLTRKQAAEIAALYPGFKVYGLKDVGIRETVLEDGQRYLVESADLVGI